MVAVFSTFEPGKLVSALFDTLLFISFRYGIGRLNFSANSSGVKTRRGISRVFRLLFLSLSAERKLFFFFLDVVVVGGKKTGPPNCLIDRRSYITNDPNVSCCPVRVNNNTHKWCKCLFPSFSPRPKKLTRQRAPKKKKGKYKRKKSLLKIYRRRK